MKFFFFSTFYKLRSINGIIAIESAESLLCLNYWTEYNSLILNLFKLKLSDQYAINGSNTKIGGLYIFWSLIYFKYLKRLLFPIWPSWNGTIHFSANLRIRRFLFMKYLVISFSKTDAYLACFHSNTTACTFPLSVTKKKQVQKTGCKN